VTRAKTGAARCGPGSTSGGGAGFPHGVVFVALLLVVLLPVALFAGGFADAVRGYVPLEDSRRYMDQPEGAVRNVILLIGDGMGLGHITLSQYAAVGPEGRLYIEAMPVAGLVTTNAADELITDSGASATAMATGRKTNNGWISIAPDGDTLATVLEMAREAGMGTGIVVTCSVTHATPACFAAHQRSRAWETRIAEDLAASGVDVLFGAGWKYFRPAGFPGSVRADDRDLLREMGERGYARVSTRAQLLAVDRAPVVGLFAEEAMTTHPPEPSLSEMTQKAITLLQKNESGFFLMVEGSQIDWAAHEHDAAGVVRQTLQFDLAVRDALEFARGDGRTLVLVTADHETGGLEIVGGGRDGSGLEIAWATGGHTPLPVPIFAYGPGAEKFGRMIDDTDIAREIMRALGFVAHASREIHPEEKAVSEG